MIYKKCQGENYREGYHTTSIQTPGPHIEYSNASDRSRRVDDPDDRKTKIENDEIDDNRNEVFPRSPIDSLRRRYGIADKIPGKGCVSSG